MGGFFQQIQGLNNKKPMQKVINKQTQKKPQKIQDIIIRWQKTKDPEDTKKIVEFLQPTIKSALHTYTPGQESTFKIKATKLALQSMRSYDKTKQTSPATYAFTSLQRLNRIRRQRQNIIHIPESQVYLKQNVDKKIQQLTQDLGRQPSTDQICDATGLSKKKLEKLEGFSTFSESSSINPETNVSTFEIPDVTDQDYYNYVYSSVSDIDKKILQWSTPYKGVPLSNNDIAKRLKLSPGAISQRKQRLQQLMGEVRGLL